MEQNPSSWFLPGTEHVPLIEHSSSTIRLASFVGLGQVERHAQSRCHGKAEASAIHTTRMTDDAAMISATDFDSLVRCFYGSLYRFAFSLSRNETEACDLTQQTFYVWATKGHQLRDPSKVKTWLFSILHHEFLKSRRRQTRFPHHELEQVIDELPTISPTTVDQLDAATVIEALRRVDELYQAPLALFYLEEHSYKEIAEILEVPIGTIQSRIARGKAQLQQMLMTETSTPGAKGKGLRG